MRFWRRIKTVGQRPFLDAAEQIADGYSGSQRPSYLRYVLIALLAVTLLILGLAWYWSDEPELFDVHGETEKALAGKSLVVGATTTATLIHTIEVLLHKPGGYLSNDMMPPGVWLDNIPSWEFGVLVQIRDLSKANREAFSRSQSQSTEDPDLAVAEPRLHIDHRSWAVPWPESEYADGQQYFRSYLERLADSQAPNAQFLLGQITCVTGWPPWKPGLAACLRDFPPVLVSGALILISPGMPAVANRHRMRMRSMSKPAGLKLIMCFMKPAAPPGRCCTF